MMQCNEEFNKISKKTEETHHSKIETMNPTGAALNVGRDGCGNARQEMSNVRRTLIILHS